MRAHEGVGVSQGEAGLGPNGRPVDLDGAQKFVGPGGRRSNHPQANCQVIRRLLVDLDW
jgi:hypothetical protein